MTEKKYLCIIFVFSIICFIVGVYIQKPDEPIITVKKIVTKPASIDPNYTIKKMKYGSIVLKNSDKFNVSPYLIYAILLHESKGKINVRGKGQCVGRPHKPHQPINGACHNGEKIYYDRGLMQVMDYNFPRDMTLQQKLDPENNIYHGTKLLAKECFVKKNTLRKRISCYNTGAGTRWIHKEYVAAVMSIKNRLENQNFLSQHLVLNN